MTEDALYPIPDSWQWTRLGEVAEVVRSQIDPQRASASSFNYLSIENVESNSGDLVNFSPTAGKKIKSTKIQFTTRDLLYSKLRPYLNKVHVPTFDGISATDLIPIRPFDGVSREYLAYFLRTRFVVDYANQRTRGIQLPRIAVEDLLKLPVPIAPSAEQMRIVSRVRDILEKNRSAKKALERTPTIIEQFRRSVLAKAFRGELTDYDPNDEPIQKVLEHLIEERLGLWSRSIHDDILVPDVTQLDGLPKHWCWTTVDQLCLVVWGASPRPARDPWLFGGIIPWITVGDLTADQSPYLRQVAQTVTEAGRDASRYIDSDTLLLTNSGATLGVPKITLIAGCINDGIVALLGLNHPLKLYLYYFLKSLTEKLRRINQGAAQPNLNTKIVRAINVPLPPLGEQRRIILQIEEFMPKADVIEEAVKGVAKDMNRLDQSVLLSAFRGRLIAQNFNDEDASVLLERIRGLRTALNQGKAFPGSKN